MGRDMDHNPLLKPWIRPKPEDAAGKGLIERPNGVANVVWQTRAAPPSEFENRLGDALVARLNEMGVRAPDGTRWSAASFEREMARLGG